MTTPTLNLSAPLTPVSYLTTALNSLGNAGYVLGAAIDPSAFTAPNANGLMMNLEVAMAAFSPGVSGYLTLWRIDSVDGTNFADGDTTNGAPAGTPIWVRGVITGTTVTRRAVFSGIVLPSTKFKFLLQNNTGATMAASGNTMSYTVYTPQYPTV